ncbi:DUF4176 domain-containing protein [Bacillus massilinigeriensis]|uniref:DUF4176 domain-containing protein n=1 Tax=Bacillus mediterraneensis TaxID=1805474 RepID=UPI0008F7E86A|nr:DUF4176 domain-containing protein [Bacillus mediterraneensis]
MSEKHQQQLKALAMERVHSILYQSDKEVPLEYWSVIKEFTGMFLDDWIVFENLLEAFRQDMESLELFSQNVDIFYRSGAGLHSVSFLGKEFALERELFADYLASCTEIMRPFLPLGSVVELDSRYFQPDPSIESAVKVVITARCIAPEGYHSYFPYAGVIYPLGEMKKDRVIHFTSPLIRSVIHEGYRDEMETSFELLMKKEMIVDRGLKSIEFSPEDMAKLQAKQDEHSDSEEKTKVEAGEH